MAPPKLPMYIVEAFTIGANQPFSGNTAAICVLDFDDDITDELKQKMGMQMNYSETAFLARGWSKDEPFSSTPKATTPQSHRWTIRWFTPTVEIDLCGYATLAASNVLFNEVIKKQGLVDTTKEAETTVVFETKYKGQLEATMNWSTGLIALNFPSNPPIPLTAVTNNNSELWVDKLLVETLGPNVSPTLVEDIAFAPDIGYLVVRLKSTGDPEKNRELLLQAAPNFSNLLSIPIPKGDLKLIAVVPTIQGWTATTLGKDKPQFFSRTIAPWVGNNEDPVCGAAHTMLTPYWVKCFQEQGIDFSAEQIVGLQLSKRKGEFLCSLQGPDRVKMVGQTRLTFSGEFYSA